MQSSEVTLNVFLLAKIRREAGPEVHCTESQCVDCEEIEAYPVPRACVGDHTPSPCWGFILDCKRSVPKNCPDTETRLGGLGLARAGAGSCLTSPAWPGTGWSSSSAYTTWPLLLDRACL